MVAPTFTSATPDAGYFIGGWRCEVIGTDFVVATDAFQFDYDPGDTGQVFQKVPGADPVFPTPPPTRRMRIEIIADGVTYVVNTVHVNSTTKLWFLLPRIHATGNTARSRGYSVAADLKLIALDSVGDPIGGDELTVVGAITLSIPRTGKTAGGNRGSVYSTIAHKLILDMRSFVDAQTRLVPHLDFEKLGVSILRKATKLPATIVSGPETTKPILGSKANTDFKVAGASGKIYQAGSYESRDLIFDIFQLDHNTEHLMDAMTLIEAYVRQTQYFLYSIFPDSPTPLQIVSTLFFERPPGIDNIPTLLPSSVRQARSRLRITSVPVGSYSDIVFEARELTAPHTATHLIHQTSKSTEDVQPDNQADIIEDDNP